MRGRRRQLAESRELMGRKTVQQTHGDIGCAGRTLDIGREEEATRRH